MRAAFDAAVLICLGTGGAGLDSRRQTLISIQKLVTSHRAFAGRGFANTDDFVY
jgi:hypothetical protein